MSAAATSFTTTTHSHRALRSSAAAPQPLLRRPSKPALLIRSNVVSKQSRARGSTVQAAATAAAMGVSAATLDRVRGALWGAFGVDSFLVCRAACVSCVFAVGLYCIA